MDHLSRRRFALTLGAAALGSLPRPLLAELPTPQSPTLRRIRETGVVRFVVSAGSAPFVVADADVSTMQALTAPDPSPPQPTSDGRRVSGLDVDLAALTAEGLGARLELQLVPRFDLVFEVLGRGEADAALAGVTRTMARAAALSFSNPYLVSGQEIVVRDDARFPTLKSVSQPGVRVGAKRDTTSESFARAALARAALSLFATGRELWQALDDGALDAVVADGFVGRDAVVQKRVRARLFSVERRRFTSESIAVAARQGDPDWTAYLSLVIREAKSSGAFQKLAHRYNAWLRAER